MRRKEREVTNMSDLLDIINMCKVCRVGMHDENGVYIVPLNFGYTVENEQITLYFHCAYEGRKLDAIKLNNNVCVEMDCDQGLIESDKACGYSYYYKSIIANGKAHLIEDIEEKIKGLKALMKHQTGKDFDFTSEMASKIAVLKIELHDISGKCRTNPIL